MEHQTQTFFSISQ